MKKLNLLLLFGGFLFQVSFSQNYVSFPTESAHWNCLFYHQISPTDIFVTNYQYTILGDTVLKGQSYKKVYFSETDLINQPIYIGGLRENSTKQIFFFPYSKIIPTPSAHTFPNDTSEQLLYTFENLSIGMILPINSDKASIEVLGIDSVLIGNNYHKRFEVQNSMLFGPEYWIEGIGSTKELLSPFTYQFEWDFYTLCFSDTETVYINSPNGADSCHYSINIGIEENQIGQIRISPNPTSDFLRIEIPFQNKTVNATIYGIQGQILLSKEFATAQTELDIRKLNSGVYYLLIRVGNNKKMTRFIKK